MLDIFTPLYINSSFLYSVFRSTYENFPNLLINLTRRDIALKASMPISELTNGRVNQGEATIELFKGFATVTIESITKCPITTFSKLYGMIDGSDILKKLNSKNNINSLKTGDIVEVTCKLSKNIHVTNLENLIMALDLDILLNGNNSESINKEKLLNTLKNTLDYIMKNLCIDWVSNKIFDKYKFVIPIDNDKITYNNKCLEDTTIKIMAKVNYMQPKLPKTNVETYTEPLFDIVKNLNLDLKYYKREFMTNEPCTYIGLIPMIIWI